MSRKKLTYGAIAVVVVLVAGGLGYYYLMPPSPAPPKEITKLQVQIGWIAEYPNRLGLWVAKDKGFYIQEGLDVEIITGKGSTYSMQILAGGKAPIAEAGAAPILNMITLNKTDMVMVWAQMQKDPTAIFFKPESGIKTPKDLEGKRVGVQKYSVSYASYIAMMGKAGADPNKVIEIPQGFDPCTPLLTGQMDATMAYWDNIATCEEKGIKANVILVADYGVDVYTNIFTVMRDYYNADKNKDILKRFLRATSKGYQYSFDHPDETAEIFLKNFPQVPKSRVERVMGIMKELMINEDTKRNGLGWMSQQAWQKAMDLYYQYGFIKAKVDPKNIFTNDFIYK